MKASLNFFKYDNNNFFKDKNVIITGATGGIGKCLTKALYSLGANLMLVCRNETKLINEFSAILNEFDYKKPKVFYEIIDMEKPNEITSAFPKIMVKLRAKVDVVFFCHAIYSKKSIREGNVYDFDTVLNVNVRSIFHLFSLLVPFLKITKGNVVILSSLESKLPILYGSLNSISKSMINSMIECSALELSNFGIRVNGIAPGLTNTLHRVDSYFNEKLNESYFKSQANSFILGKKIIEPEDIVNTMLFLASDQAAFITGEIMVVDRGYSLDHEGSYGCDQ